MGGGSTVSDVPLKSSDVAMREDCRIRGAVPDARQVDLSGWVLRRGLGLGLQLVADATD